MEHINIDVINELFNDRNKNISETTKNHWINCLGLIYKNNNQELSMLSICEKSIKNLKENYTLKLENIIKEDDKGVSDQVIVENAAICVNLCTLPRFYDYKSIEVLQVGEGADYICYNNPHNFIFESKGVNSKYNCPGRAKKGSDQINKAFNIYNSKNIHVGIVGLSCFYNNIHYLINIKK